MYRDAVELAIHPTIALLTRQNQVPHTINGQSSILLLQLVREKVIDIYIHAITKQGRRSRE